MTITNEGLFEDALINPHEPSSKENLTPFTVKTSVITCLTENDEKEKNPNNYKGDAYLGDIATVSDEANIVCRDFEYVDGDRVRILVNDKIVVQNLTLDSSFRGINLKLGKGFNKIDFVALNQGSSGPNTAELRIYDDNKKLLSSNQWNLATGSKATLIIVKK